MGKIGFDTKELEIMKAALEGDVIRQKKHIETIDNIEFQKWLVDTEQLLKTISLMLFERKSMGI
jgi:hypothetical protein